MPFDGPGLDYQPDDDALVGFQSLMPEPEKKPNPIVAVLKVPLKILALPLRLLRALVRLPARLFSRSSSED